MEIFLTCLQIYLDNTKEPSKAERFNIFWTSDVLILLSSEQFLTGLKKKEKGSYLIGKREAL